MEKHVSFSQIKIFQQCPVWWDAVYNKGMSRESNKWADIGTAVHEFLASGEWKGDPGIVAEAKKIVERFDIQRFNPGQYPEKEVKITRRVADVEVLGYIDALDENKFVDWKTNHTTNADPTQLAIYAWLIAGNNPWYQTFTGQFVYVRLNSYDKYTFGIDDLANVETWLEEQVKKMFHPVEEFKPQPGAHCAYCPILEQCSKSLDIVGQYKLTKLRLKQLTDAIKETVKDEPIITPSGMATFSQSTRVSFSKKIADLDWVPKTVDKDAIKKDKELYEKLKSEGYIKESVYSSLKIE